MTVYTVDTDVCLFDLDGTIITTIVAAEEAWTKLCKQHNVDPQELFKISHGTRTVEVLAQFFPDIDNTDNKGVHLLEADIADNYLDTIGVIPGARELLSALDKDPQDQSVNFRKEQKRKWAIVTSGSPYMATSWFSTILKDIGKPEVFITAENVSVGKPDPEGYTKARELLSTTWNYKSSCRAVVFEDAPVGIRAGNAMNAVTIGITSSYSKQTLFAAGADYVVADLTHVTVTENTENGHIKLQIKDPLIEN
ncbi:similar to Saccharomyces cerevisiae YHR043C DOG2 deoxyglucose-6-phosphate phosphatase [Maudiozyma saulgeensis]|uniref:Similar to Saccharomyces cerevisiae YHR043C DOG2 deoxyglucose-6-phosphate phosphatase n=1 Tax=Maudiozyma saulgeensis TaxID=1789683 RepID=A0A1X7R6W7_9SACH|nr:similar to Saccharomyces cerevisiae YHR043C DOG2 deoxyglucose-6-phosphate phosphatase [Kazachstania saulgeensis]